MWPTGGKGVAIRLRYQFAVSALWESYWYEDIISQIGTQSSAMRQKVYNYRHCRSVKCLLSLVYHVEVIVSQWKPLMQSCGHFRPFNDRKPHTGLSTCSSLWLDDLEKSLVCKGVTKCNPYRKRHRLEKIILLSANRNRRWTTYTVANDL